MLVILFSGTQLPFALADSTMISFPEKDRVVLVGGYNMTEENRILIQDILDRGGYPSDYLDIPYWTNELLELQSNTMEWTVMDQKMKYGRRSHVAFLIPDEMTICKMTNP